MGDKAQKIRVIIADDHEMVRHGLAGFLAAFPDLELVGQAANGKQAVTLCAEKHPDVVLMDLIMPELNGVDATREIRSNQPDIKVIALTSSREPSVVRDALQAGAIAFLSKDISIHDLGEAIRAAARGKPTLSAEALRSLVSHTREIDRPAIDLTPREIEILHLMASSLRNPEIALKLTVSVSTVKTHISNLLKKLGAPDRHEAVRIARERKLL
jgi:NarL family two-component system response regulator LiaR